MTTKLTAKIVAGLDPHADGRDHFVFDTELKQFGVRVRYDRDHIVRRAFILQYKFGKAQRRTKLADFPTVTVEQAREKAKSMMPRSSSAAIQRRRRGKQATRSVRSSSSI